MAAIDGVTAELRNRTRQVQWAEFQQTSIANIENAQDWQSLYRAIDDVHYGIINRHSYVLVEDAIAKQFTKLDRWPAIKVGYYWPEISFFEIATNKVISRINGTAIEEIFYNFYNWYCNDVHVSGCLALFSQAMEAGYRFADKRDHMLVEYADQTSKSFKKTPRKSQPEEPEHSCENHYLNSVATMRYSGQQSCLFETQQAWVIKIFYFGDWGTDEDDIYCLNATEAGMCGDITQIRNLINQSAPRPLIVDLQDNGGGSENTPWIAAITPDGFYDTQTQFRNLPLLQKDSIRESAFYYSEQAETWYQNIKSDVNPSDDYLPVRGDFCRASELCDSSKIPSAKDTIKFAELKLVINNGCVSSCDDLVLRTRESAGAISFGQLPATDAAYSRLNGYIFLTEDNKIHSIILGEDQTPENISGTLLVSWRIPISRSVDKQGNLLEGSTSVLDHPLPVTVDNYSNLQLNNFKRTLQFEL